MPYDLTIKLFGDPSFEASLKLPDTVVTYDDFVDRVKNILSNYNRCGSSMKVYYYNGGTLLPVEDFDSTCHALNHWKSHSDKGLVSVQFDDDGHSAMSKSSDGVPTSPVYTPPPSYNEASRLNSSVIEPCVYHKQQPVFVVSTPPVSPRPAEFVASNVNIMDFWKCLTAYCEGHSSELDSLMNNALVGVPNEFKETVLTLSLSNSDVQNALRRFCVAWGECVKKTGSGFVSSVYTPQSGTTPAKAVTRGMIIMREGPSPIQVKKGCDDKVVVVWHVKNCGEIPWHPECLKLKKMKGPSNSMESLKMSDRISPNEEGKILIEVNYKYLSNCVYDYEWDIQNIGGDAVLKGLTVSLEVSSNGFSVPTYPSMTTTAPAASSSSSTYSPYMITTAPAASSSSSKSSPYYSVITKDYTLSHETPDDPKPLKSPPVIPILPVLPVLPEYNKNGKSKFSALFERDVTLKELDQCNKIRRGQSRVKIWRLRNNGSLQWPAGCTLIPTEKSSIRCRDGSVPCAKPGETIDVFIVLEVPDSASADEQFHMMLIDPDKNPMLTTPLNVHLDITYDSPANSSLDKLINDIWDHARYRDH